MLIPIGAFARDITTPVRANGARITLIRLAWPVGPLFNWRLFERERDGVLQLLTSGEELGGPAARRDGLPGDAPLVITLSWLVDKDKDLIRFEADVFQAFNTTASLEWL